MYTKWNMKKIAVVFPGQGSHFIGMYKALYDEYEIVRETIKEAEQVTGINLSELCFKGPLSVLSRSKNAHVAILAFGVAAFRVFVSETGLIPQFCAGHSLGEYTALVCAGTLKFSDALKLVQIRSEISEEIKKTSNSGMTIIDGIETNIVENICKEQQIKGKKVYVSCYNSDTQTAISGINDDLQEAEKIIHRENCTVSPLFNSAPFHCPIMEGGINALKNLIKSIEFGEFRYPVMSNYTGKPYIKEEEFEINLLKHLTNPVKWIDIINYFESKDVNLIIDFSANNIFEKIIGSNNSIRTVCFGVKRERETLFRLFQGPEYTSSRSTFISKSIIAAISTPNFNYDEKKYNDGVVENYKILQELGVELDSGRAIYSQDMKKNILTLLKLIFQAKNVNRDEQNRWIQQILDETASSYENLI